MNLKSNNERETGDDTMDLVQKSGIEVALESLNDSVKTIKEELIIYRKENGERLERLIVKLENHEVRISVIEDRQKPESQEIKKKLMDNPYVKYPVIAIIGAVGAVIVQIIQLFVK